VGRGVGWGRTGASHAEPGGGAHAVAPVPGAPPQRMPATSFSSVGVVYCALTANSVSVFPPLARRNNGAAGKAPRANLPTCERPTERTQGCKGTGPAIQLRDCA
jgi:hypothetical protein